MLTMTMFGDAALVCIDVRLGRAVMGKCMK